MGWPIAHSLSPQMHNAAFDALGMNWRYVALPVHPSQVGAAVKGLCALGFRGCNQRVRRWTKPDNHAPIPNGALDLTRSKSELMLENALPLLPSTSLPPSILDCQLCWRMA
jgi:hypothetical protein